MKRIQVVLLAIMVGMLSSCATVYKNATFEQEVSELKTMAIIPFNVHIKPAKSAKNRRVEQDIKTQNDEGFRLQNEIYIQFLRKNELLNTSIQDISLTNSKLTEAGYDLNNLKSLSKNKLAEVLGVDMVLSGEVFEKKPVSTGGAIAIGAATALLTPVGLFLPFIIPTNEVIMDINLHKKNESILMWKYHHTISGGLGSSPEKIGDLLVKEVITKIPVIKKKVRSKKK